MSRRLRAAATAGLLSEARGLSGDFDRLSQAVAEKVGLSQTDLLAMDLITRDGHVTAGQIASHLHLTTGAITGLIDRLERSGFAKRQDDAKDRRRVVVVATPKGDRVGELFAPLAVALRRSTEGYSEPDLVMLTDFVKKMRTAVARTVDAIRD
ncbi:MAG TPA: MarR family transcriptional regulator [Candidatus Limnocylindrales bacterium]|nr:MarR family transcriptional regulator [Candidatus Limnocylindrales bacterium]